MVPWAKTDKQLGADPAGAGGRQHVRVLNGRRAVMVSLSPPVRRVVAAGAVMCPTMVGSLHRAPAQWYEQQGYVVDAVRHAQAARDWPQAARLLADNYVDLILDGSKWRATPRSPRTRATPRRAGVEPGYLATAAVVTASPADAGALDSGATSASLGARRREDRSDVLSAAVSRIDLHCFVRRTR